MGSNQKGCVWVVGGTSGIGKAIFDKLSDEFEVDAIATGKFVDVRHQVALLSFVEGVKRKIDKIIYCVGVNKLMWSEEMVVATALNMYDVNVMGLLRVLRAANEVERVVVVGSDAAWRPMRASGAYCASKAALHQMVACIARERSTENFSINVVAPGMTETPMADNIDREVLRVRGWSDAKALEYERSQIPLGRRAKPSEIAEVVCNVLLTETPYMTGAVITVNGGRY